MKNGLYKVTFQSSLGAGTGVVVLNDGRLLGGNSAISYVGTYRVVDNAIVASIETKTHTPVPGMENVLGVPDIVISLSGALTPTGARVSGSSPVAAGVKLQVTLEFLAA